MRDVDADWATVLVMRRGESIDAPAELAGRTLALGSSDSGHAAILPLHYLAEQGLHAERDCELLRFDTDLGKHGDTGDSELRVVRAVSAGDAEAGALSDAYFSAFRADGPARGRRARGRLAQPDVLPLQLHRARQSSTRSLGRGGARHCSPWTTTIRRCGRRWSSRASALAARWPRGLRLADGGDAGAGPSVVTAAPASPAHRIDAEHLELGGGLEVLLAASMRARAVRRDPRDPDTVAGRGPRAARLGARGRPRPRRRADRRRRLARPCASGEWRAGARRSASALAASDRRCAPAASCTRAIGG